MPADTTVRHRVNPRAALAAATVATLATFVVAGTLSSPSLLSTSAALTDDAEETSSMITERGAAAQLIAAGLTPDVLAAAGVDGRAARAVLAAAHEYVLQHQTELRAADRLVGEARRASADRAGQESLATATVARRDQLDALIHAATAELPPETRAAITTVRRNAGREGIPTKFLAADRSEDQWFRLREDLSHVRQAAKFGTDPDPEVLARVRDAESHSAVVAADLAINSNRDAISTLFNARR